MSTIRYWFDVYEQKLIVLDDKSGKRREIRKPKKIAQFLRAYGLTSTSVISSGNEWIYRIT